MLVTLLLKLNFNFLKAGRPFAGSVRKTVKSISYYMRDLRPRGVTRLYDEHEMSRVSKRSDRKKSGDTEKHGATCTTNEYSSSARWQSLWDRTGTRTFAVCTPRAEKPKPKKIKNQINKHDGKDYHYSSETGFRMEMFKGHG